MSDEVKITIVTGVEKKNNGLEDKNEEKIVLTHDSSMTLMSTLRENGLLKGSFCGGRGDCGRCRVQFLEGAGIPTPIERSVMEPWELREGYRLACFAKPKNDCVIRLDAPKEKKVPIISEMIDVSSEIDQIGQHKSNTKYRKSNAMEQSDAPAERVSQSSEARFFIAVDLGTTTVVMQLCETETGKVVDTYCAMNPQRSYGADVLSRIQASCEGHREKLQEMIWAVLEQGIARFSNITGHLCCMCIAGNTAMEHLLMGYDVSTLGKSPFVPVETELQECHRKELPFPVYIAPCISAFVGGDIVAGLYAMGMLGQRKITDVSKCSGEPAQAQSQEGTQQPQEKTQLPAALFIDLGTNGEMALTDGRRMLVTATAAGPAFEGGAGSAEQIIGTDMVAVTAGLLEQGIMDETGLLQEPYFDEGVTAVWQSCDETAGDDRQKYRFEAGINNMSLKNNMHYVYIKQEDIRAIQLAKAAVRAGVEILWERMGRPSIDKVYLAGGFGYYLDVEAALRIGLLPEKLRGRVQAVGNASLAGACRMGQDLCVGALDKDKTQRMLSSIESVNLATQTKFQELYVRYISLKCS